MKLIGIIGKSGSGKTTLSRMLERDSNIGVIHLDEVIDMKKIKEKMPSGLIDKNLHTNAQGEEFMILDKRVRKIRDRIIKNKLLRKLYFKILHLPREIFIKKALHEKIEEGKEIIIFEGATLGDFSIYNKFDYLIQIDAPFIERKKRIIERNDILYDKDTVANRDLGFRQAQNRAKKKGKTINEKIENIGSKADLQKIADRIYSEQILTKDRKPRETMIEKYGGYKVKLPSKFNSKIEKVKSKIANKNDLTK